MKLNLRLTGKNRGRLLDSEPKSTNQTGEPEAPETTDVLDNFRRLKWYELVCRGDFVANEHRGFELWEGPRGFRANAFVKPIFRRQENRSTRARKSK